MVHNPSWIGAKVHKGSFRLSQKFNNKTKPLVLASGAVPAMSLRPGRQLMNMTLLTAFNDVTARMFSFFFTLSFPRYRI